MGLKEELASHGKIGFGAMGLSSFYGKPTPEDQAMKVVQHAINVGCTHIDTADIYGPRTNERMIGKVLANKELRSKVLLATKFGGASHEEGKLTGPGSGKPDNVRAMLDGCIERLGCTPDIFYLHRVDPQTPIEETVKAMDEGRKAGKFRYLGISEMSAETLERAARTVKVDVIQIEFSPWSTDIERNGIADVAQKYGIAVVAYAPLGRGFLTGRFKSPDDFPEGDFRKTAPRFQGENFETNLKIVSALEKIGQRHGASSGQAVLAWIVSKGYFPIAGSTNPRNIDENAAARDLHLSEQDLADIDKIVREADIAGERYNQQSMKSIGH